MTRVEMKRQLKALANEQGNDVIRISFNSTKDYTIATMYVIDKTYDVIFRETYWSDKGTKNMRRIDSISGIMVLRKAYFDTDGEKE